MIFCSVVELGNLHKTNLLEVLIGQKLKNSQPIVSVIDLLALQSFLTKSKAIFFQNLKNQLQN
jgi:hypothetical protein